MVVGKSDNAHTGIYMTITSVQEIEAYQATVCGRGKTSLCFHRKLCSRIDNCMRHVSGSRTYNPSGTQAQKWLTRLFRKLRLAVHLMLAVLASHKSHLKDR